MRRFLQVFVSLGAITLLAVATLPWWWGAALRMAGPSFGVDFERYERLGYSRWALSGVEWNGDPGRFTAQRIELPHPLALVLQGQSAGAVQLTAWQWVNAPKNRESNDAVSARAGWSETMGSVQALLSWLPQRVPPVEATEGTIQAGAVTLTISSVHWDPAAGAVSFDELNFQDHLWSGSVQWDAPESRLSGQVASADGTAQFTATEQQVQGEGTWWQQPWTASATFGSTGWLPLEAEVAAPAWELAGAKLGLGGRYETVHGNALATWAGDRFDLNVTADGEPVADLKLPPLKLEAKAHGGLDRLVIDRLDATAPGLQAHLSEAVSFGHQEWSEAWNTPATFTVETDLSTFTNGQGSGTLLGRVHLIPVQDTWPQLEAQLQADSMHWQDSPEVSGFLAATFDGKTIQVGSLKFTSDDSTQVEASGAWSLDDQEASDVTVKGTIARRWLARWLPEDLSYAHLQLNGTAHGKWPELVHEGTLIVEEVTYDKLNPSAWKIEWEGQGENVQSTLQGDAGESRLTMVSSVTPSRLSLEALTLHRADGAELNLVAPAILTLTPEFKLEPLRLAGDEASLMIASGATGRLQVEGSGLRQTWLDDWMELPESSWLVENVQVDGMVKDGVWVGKIATQVALTIGENRSARLALAMVLDDAGLRIEEGAISEGGLPILNITAQVPLWLTPENENAAWKFDASAPLAAEFSSASNPAFWEQINQAMGIEVKAPVIQGTLSGSWSKPEGAVSIGAELLRVDAERSGAPWPELKMLQARLIGGDDGLQLEGLTALIAGQSVQASGRLPWSRDKWERLRDDPWSYLREAGEGRIEIADADLSAWATLAPTVLAPLGRLQLSLEISPGGRVDGSLKLQNAATRPLGPLGAMQDITALVRFQDREVVIESMEAQIGGRPVELQGAVSWLASGKPKFDFTLEGQNLPFVRQTGLLLRGDIDLKLQTDDDGHTWLRGDVGLRDGLFLVDLQSLRPSSGGGGGGSGRPPYFRVTDQPFADWRLDVAVKGKHFLRMETPAFSGRASADFQLQGNLKEPRAVGEATLTEGLVKLPFATFDVSEGWVRLRQSDPYVPRLSVIGTARRMGYDLRMELSGTASAPDLQFFSNPPLTSEEVLLLVMAGQSPENEINYTSSQRATKLGAYLGQNLINQFTGNTNREERLMVSLGEKVSQGGKETYRIEYYLNGRWSVVGEYDEFDDYNAGVKWKVFTSQTEKEDDEEE